MSTSTSTAGANTSTGTEGTCSSTSDTDTVSISSSILHNHNHDHHGHHDHHHHHHHHQLYRRRAHLPPLPDLRFEQSYLASISGAHGDPWKIVLITIRDQVVFPLFQGMLFSLGMAGWRAWSARARLLGRAIGQRIRKGWWAVNGVAGAAEVKVKDL